MNQLCDLSSETRALLALNLVPGLGPRLTRELLSRWGSAERVLQATAAQLREVPHIGEKTAQQLAAAFRTVNVQDEIDRMAEHGCRLVLLGDGAYPPLLANIANPPHLLYVRGDETVLRGPMVAIVGSRHCTSYGRRITEKLAADLSRAGLVIVSGLARGIDGHAHRGALNAGGKTVAVLAGGLADIYPPEHADLAEEIVRAGALISETPLDFAPMAGMFPARNRIISGMSRGVIIVEAAAKSGALITARHAAEQGREVMAVPGPVDSEASRGALKLIREGAVLIRHANDVLAALGELPPAADADTSSTGLSDPPIVPPGARIPLTEKQQQLFDLLAEAPVHADDLVARAGMDVSEVGIHLAMMEMQGVVRRLPGNRFERQ